jgi:hypothetical protein
MADRASSVSRERGRISKVGGGLTEEAELTAVDASGDSGGGEEDMGWWGSTRRSGRELSFEDVIDLAA